MPELNTQMALEEPQARALVAVGALTAHLSNLGSTLQQIAEILDGHDIQRADNIELTCTCHLEQVQSTVARIAALLVKDNQTLKDLEQPEKSAIEGWREQFLHTKGGTRMHENHQSEQAIMSFCDNVDSLVGEGLLDLDDEEDQRAKPLSRETKQPLMPLGSSGLTDANTHYSLVELPSELADVEKGEARPSHTSVASSVIAPGERSPQQQTAQSVQPEHRTITPYNWRKKAASAHLPPSISNAVKRDLTRESSDVGDLVQDKGSSCARDSCDSSCSPDAMDVTLRETASSIPSNRSLHSMVTVSGTGHAAVHMESCRQSTSLSECLVATTGPVEQQHRHLAHDESTAHDNALSAHQQQPQISSTKVAADEATARPTQASPHVPPKQLAPAHRRSQKAIGLTSPSSIGLFRSWSDSDDDGSSKYHGPSSQPLTPQKSSRFTLLRNFRSSPSCLSFKQSAGLAPVRSASSPFAIGKIEQAQDGSLAVLERFMRPHLTSQLNTVVDLSKKEQAPQLETTSGQLQRASSVLRKSIFRSSTSAEGSSLEAARTASAPRNRGKKHRLIVAEDSSGRVHWDMLVICLILNYMVVMPLRSAFQRTSNSDFIHIKGLWLYVELLADAIFIIDILVNFRTSFRLNDGTLIDDPRTIAARYVRSWFWLDLISSFPIDFAFLFVSPRQSAAGSNLKFVRTIRVLRYSKVLRVMRLYNMNGRLLNSTLNPGVIQLWRLSITLGAAWHFVACCYWIIAAGEGFCKPEGYDDPNGQLSFDDGFNRCLDYWAPYVGYRYRSLQQQYSQAFFWAVQVSTGIGKDVVPRTNVEVGFTIVVIIWGMLMYASIIGAISSAVSVLDAHGIQRSERLGRIKTYLLKHGVKKQLQVEIMNYYKYIMSTTTQAYESADLHDLPVILRMKLELALKQETVHAIPLFRGLHAACILSVVHHLKSDIALPTEILYSAGAMGDRMFVVEKGTILLTVPRYLKQFIMLRKRQKKKYEILGKRLDRFRFAGQQHTILADRPPDGSPSPCNKVPHSRRLHSEPSSSYADWRRKLADFQAGMESSNFVTVEKLNTKSDYFGEASLLHQTHLTYATSEVLSELHFLRYRDIQSTITEFPSFALRLKEVTSMRIARCFEVLEHFASQDENEAIPATAATPTSFFADTEEKEVAAFIIQGGLTKCLRQRRLREAANSALKISRCGGGLHSDQL